MAPDRPSERPAAPAAQRVLIVEDDPHSLELATRFVEESGAAVLGATSVDAAREILARHGAEIVLVITDVKLREQSGLDLFQTVRRDRPGLPVILITAFGSTDEAVAAMKDGALHYFTKPVNFPLLLRLVREVLEKQALQAQVTVLRARLERVSDRQILGSGRAITAALEQAAAVAELDTTVLLCGETGTGKELFAQFIQAHSPRRSRPMVTINCAALPEALLESELFGHERGAFTGAVARKPGKFEAASGGTIFLDEVADMSLALQAKLLRALEAKQIEPLGATRSVRVDVRIIAATNRDLAQAVQTGSFREDVYYRLNVFPITLPPLRERPEDIPALAAHFLQTYARIAGKRIDAMEPAVLDGLQSHTWPGNVRELRHSIERAVILAKGPTLALEHFPLAIARGGVSTPGARVGRLADLEREAVVSALNDAAGNHSRAARALGITRNQIQYRLKKLGLV